MVFSHTQFTYIKCVFLPLGTLNRILASTSRYATRRRRAALALIMFDHYYAINVSVYLYECMSLEANNINKYMH